MHDVVQLDIVSSAMFVLVSTLALVVVRYSRTYLAGQRELDRYARSLLLTVASVTRARDLEPPRGARRRVVRDRRRPALSCSRSIERAARRSSSRTRSSCSVARRGRVLRRRRSCSSAAELGSLRIDVVNTFARASGELSPTLHLATVLLVFGVLLKSAQLPFHGWMQQVMEAPTPVSALLHAGVVNIGGFVMIRLAPLMAHAYDRAEHPRSASACSRRSSRRS